MLIRKKKKMKSTHCEGGMNDMFLSVKITANPNIHTCTKLK